MCPHKTGAVILSRLCLMQPRGSHVLSVTSGGHDSSLELSGLESNVLPGDGSVSEGEGPLRPRGFSSGDRQGVCRGPEGCAAGLASGAGKTTEGTANPLLLHGPGPGPSLPRSGVPGV